MPTPASLRDLADRIDRAYSRCKLFPDKSPSGQVALLELRNLAPETIDALRAMADDAEQWVEIERMRLGEG